jgi:hypothetical protein
MYAPPKVALLLLLVFNNTFCAKGASGRRKKVSLPTPLPLFARPQRSEEKRKKKRKENETRLVILCILSS